MKIKLMCDMKDYDHIKARLEQGGFTISEDTDFILYDRTIELNYLIGKIKDEYEMIPIDEIIYIESFAHDVVVHTKEDEYFVKEKLYQLEGMLENQGFIRVNNQQLLIKVISKE